MLNAILAMYGIDPATLIKDDDANLVLPAFEPLEWHEEKDLAKFMAKHLREGVTKTSVSFVREIIGDDDLEPSRDWTDEESEWFNSEQGEQQCELFLLPNEKGRWHLYRVKGA